MAANGIGQAIQAVTHDAVDPLDARGGKGFGEFCHLLSPPKDACSESNAVEQPEAVLRNRVYLGEINHKGASYPGEHVAIVDRAVFDAVQEKLTANRNGAKVRRAASAALLIGRIFDDRGHPMTPSTAKKGSIRYRYYVSSMLAQGRRNEAGTIARVSAPEIEAVVVDALRALHPTMLPLRTEP